MDFEGGPQTESLDIGANKMGKHGVLDRVLKKHEFTMDFRYQNERPVMVKVMCLQYACCNLRGFGGYEI